MYQAELIRISQRHSITFDTNCCISNLSSNKEVERVVEVVVKGLVIIIGREVEMVVKGIITREKCGIITILC